MNAPTEQPTDWQRFERRFEDLAASWLSATGDAVLAAMRIAGFCTRKIADGLGWVAAKVELAEDESAQAAPPPTPKERGQP